MNNNWNKILNELSYRVSSGIPDLSNEQHLMKLWDILKEEKWSVEARVELFENLTEARLVRNPNPSPNKKKDMVTVPYARTFYDKQGVDTDKLSDDEIESMAASDDKIWKIEPEEAPERNKDLDQEAEATNEFNEGKLSEDGVSDEDFENNERVKPLPNQISLEEIEEAFPKPLPFPRKYLKVLQRLLNTNKKGGVTISDFTDAAGGGTLESTGGEILTMMLTSIEDDNIANQLSERLIEHVKSNGNSNSIISKTWIESAVKCRQAIRDRYDRTFGKGNWKLKNQAWDIEEEVEALGMSDYKKNKGFSTDVYFTLEVDGVTILDEVSLKQSRNANLLNATTGRVYDILMRGNGTEEQIKRYDELHQEREALKESINTANKKELKERLGPAKAKEFIDDIDNRINSITGQLVELEDEVIPDKIPENLEVKVAQQKQDEGHRNSIKKNEKELLDAISNFDNMSEEEQEKVLDDIGGPDAGGGNKGLNQKTADMKSFKKKQREFMAKVKKHLDSGKSLSDYFKRMSKDKRKALAGIYLMTEEGSESRKDWEEIKDTSRQHSKDVAKYLFENKEAKEGLIKSIREDFPLQALLSGEESMALGDLSADKETLKAIFGTDDFSEIQQNLTIVGDSIVYKVKGTGKEIPISRIVSRPDGIGYGTSWKLEMKLHPKFADKLEEQNKKGK